MRLLNNASMTAKSLVPSSLSALAIVVIVGMSWWSYTVFEAGNEMKDAGVAVMSAARDTRIEFSRAHASLYRAISLKSQNVEVKIVGVAKNEALQAMGQAKNILGAVTTGQLPFDPGLIDKARRALDDYIVAAKLSAGSVEEDAFNATMFMTDAEQKFGVAEKAISGFVAGAVAVNDAVANQVSATMQKTLLVTGIAAFAAILSSVGIGIFFSRLISLPIKEMTAGMRRLAAGDLDTALPTVGREDEVGAMAKALVVFRDNAVAASLLAGEQAEAQAGKAARSQRLDGLMHGFEDKVSIVASNLANAAGEMMRAAVTVTKATDQASDRSIAVASASEEASANVQTVAAAAEELSNSIREISKQVQQSAQTAQRAVKGANHSSTIIADLARGVHKIGEVVELISGIASQTNLLALNATIEAARAGEAGRGFAVVAFEVKSLATQTAKATDDIARQIEAIQHSSGDAVTAIDEIARVISEMDQVAAAIAAAVEEQGAATRAIACSVQQAATGTHDVSSNIHGVSTAVTESAEVAEQVRKAAEDLAVQSEILQREVGEFLSGVKAA
jgi:methyl-accepting chemotaxis protein